MRLIHVIQTYISPPDPVLVRLYYPLYLFTVESRLKRLAFGDRVEPFVVTVDGCLQTTARCDIMPPALEQEVPDELVLPPTLALDEARRLAEKFVMRLVLRRYTTFWPPAVSARAGKLLYKRLDILDGEGGKTCFDSVSGRTELLKLPSNQ